MRWPPAARARAVPCPSAQRWTSDGSRTIACSSARTRARQSAGPAQRSARQRSREGEPVDLTGKVSVVTGAAQGNGLGIASALASAGSHVLLADINDEQLDRAIGSLRAKGYQVDPVHCDVTEEESVEALMEQAGALGGPHVLVAQAGLDYSNLIPDTTLADWNRIFAVDMVGTFLCVRAAIPRMAELGGGSIITMSG